MSKLGDLQLGLLLLLVAVVIFLLPMTTGGNVLDHIGIAFGFAGFYTLGVARERLHR